MTAARFFKDFLKAPLGKDPFAGGEGDMGFLGDFGHDVHIEGLDDLFIEPGLVLFEGFDQQQRGRRFVRHRESRRRYRRRRRTCRAGP